LSVPEALVPFDGVERSYEQVPVKQGWVQSFSAVTVWVVDKRRRRSGRRDCEGLVGIVEMK